MTPEALAQQFHEIYERVAPTLGYTTRTESRTPWADVPEQTRNLMIAVCQEILSTTFATALEAAREEEREEIASRIEGMKLTEVHIGPLFNAGFAAAAEYCTKQIRARGGGA